MRKRFVSMFTAGIVSLCTCSVSMPSVMAEGAVYPENYKEYTELLESCPDLYRVDEDSVYFIDPRLPMSVVPTVSSHQSSDVEKNEYGFIFTPESDGTYVVSIAGLCEDHPTFSGVYSENDEPVLYDGHFHYFYPMLFSYTVNVVDGNIKVSKGLEFNGYSEDEVKKASEEAIELSLLNHVPIDCFDVTSESNFDRAYYSFVNGRLHEDDYITNIYHEFKATESIFCLNADLIAIPDIYPYPQRVELSNYDIAELLPDLYVSSDISTDDILSFFRVKALKDGDITVRLDGKSEYDLKIEDGLFAYDTPEEKTENILKVSVVDYETGELLRFTEDVVRNISFRTGRSVEYVLQDHTFAWGTQWEPESTWDYYAFNPYTIDIPDHTISMFGATEYEVTGIALGNGYYLPSDYLDVTENYDNNSADINIRLRKIVKGDVNEDGKFTVADAVRFQKWLLNPSDTTLNPWQAVDFCRDGKLDIFDFTLMKKELLEQS